MPLIPVPPAPEPKDTIAVRLDQALHDQLKQYAEFIHGTKDYVIGHALQHLFRKDKEFAAWVTAQGAHATTHAPSTTSAQVRAGDDHSTTSTTARETASARPRPGESL
jgi:predicted transcriptional regulator